MTQTRQSSTFGRRKEPHTVIIARGDKIHHFTVRPWIAAILGSAVAAVAIGYLLATTYLVLRDDLIGATVARQARMQQAYEDRISALRAQVDRITSRQLLDQQVMEDKVGELLARQAELAERQGRIAPLLKKAGDAPAETAPAKGAKAKSDDRAAADALPINSLVAAAPSKADVFASLFATKKDDKASEADNSDRLFLEINRSLRTIEDGQIARLRSLTENAFVTAETINAALADAGLAASAEYGVGSVGGPLVALSPGLRFDSAVTELDDALSTLEKVKTVARKLPIFNPAPGKQVSSNFGVRKDPFRGTPALHAGMDFRAAPGASVRSAGAGKVVSAGWNGGYGKMVEVDHGNGLTTRYAHMSAITVKEGDVVVPGDVVGKVGSTGRSTGPHLHYEVRRNGEALNPLRFIKAGRKIESLL